MWGRSAALKASVHIVGNYLRALKRFPDTPYHYHFHYSRNETNLRQELTGLTPKIVSFIDLMEKKGLISNQKAKPSFGAGGKESTFCFNPAFHDFMQNIINRDFGSIEQEVLKASPIQYVSPLLIYKENLPERTPKQNRQAKAQKIEQRRGKRAEIHRTLVRYNKLLEESALELNIKALEGRLDIRGIDFDPESLSESTTVYRQYADKDMHTHGRFYGGAWMNMPSKLRPFLCIDGEPTVELDFQGMQPNLLFTHVGEHPPYGDPYEVIEGCNNLYTTPQTYRALVKEAFMYLLNSTASPNRLVGTLSSKKIREFKAAMRDSSPYTWDEDIEANHDLHLLYQLFDNRNFRKQLDEDISKAWAPIWPYFEYKSFNWRQVTKWESDIAHEVIKEMTALGIIILPIHDAFIVKERHKDTVLESMRNAYKRVMGTTDDYVPRIRF